MSTTTATEHRSAPQRLRGRPFLESIVRAWPLLAALMAITLVYVPSFDDYFHGDDFLAFIDLTTKPVLRYLSDVITYNDVNVYWRPLGQVYFLGLYTVFGLNPVAFHIANLGVFLLTLVLLYHFCVRLGLGRGVALGAVLCFGLIPNHAVSVAWTTNGPRLLAVLFALVAVMLVQSSLRNGKGRYEALAFLAMLLAVLSDETAASLTPVPVIYAFFALGRRNWRSQVTRGVVYAALGVSVALLQLTVGIEQNQAPTLIGLSEFGPGWHVGRQLWALVARLAWPTHDGVTLDSITAAQWAAGAIVSAVGTGLLAIGSARARFLVLWTLLALLPFALWSVPIAPARYVYMAALPFAILVAWAGGTMVRLAFETRFWQRDGFGLTPVFVYPALMLLAVGLWQACIATVDRGETFARSAEPYRALAQDLPRVLPDMPAGSRIVVYYSVWTGFSSWRDAVVQSVYQDASLTTVSVDRTAMDGGDLPQVKAGDIVVYYTPGGFVLPAKKTDALPRVDASLTP